MFRILICKPGGRYGQLPSSSYMLDLGNKVARFRSRESAQNEVDRMMGKKSYKQMPAGHRPTYKIV